MPPTRRLKTALLLALFATLTILYITHGATNTYNSQFYTRTVAAIQTRHDTEAREALIAEEKTRADRVARIQEEHEKAMGAAKQKPIVEDTAGSEHSVKAQEAPAAAAPEGKPVAGRKMMPSDGNGGNGGKVVVNPNADDDGVARVGNGGAAKSRESSVASKSNEKEEEETEFEHEIETEMNSILKKGPIIIFSKSYCPFSKKAKVRFLPNHPLTETPAFKATSSTNTILLPRRTSSSRATQ